MENFADTLLEKCHIYGKITVYSIISESEIALGYLWNQINCLETGDESSTDNRWRYRLCF